MKRYTPERGYGLDLTGPSPVWRGKKPRWKRKAANDGWYKRLPTVNNRFTATIRDHHTIYLPTYRIDEYIKKGFLSPDQRTEIP